MDTNGLIDNRNFELWNSLQTVHDIEIRKENRPNYLAFSKSGKTIISVPFDKKETASFSVLADSLVLRNPLLRQAPKR